MLATPAGLEPATLCLEGRCSIRKSIIKINNLTILSFFGVTRDISVAPCFQRKAWAISPLLLASYNLA